MLNWSGREDLNLRPLDPQSSALPSCATPRKTVRIIFGLEAVATTQQAGLQVR